MWGLLRGVSGPISRPALLPKAVTRHRLFSGTARGRAKSSEDAPAQLPKPVRPVSGGKAKPELTSKDLALHVLKLVPSVGVRHGTGSYIISTPNHSKGDQIYRMRNSLGDILVQLLTSAISYGILYSAEVLSHLLNDILVDTKITDKSKTLAKAGSIIEAHNTTPAHLVPILDILVANPKDEEGYEVLLSELIFHLLKNKDKIQIRNILGNLQRRWIPSYNIEIDDQDIFWVDYSMWSKEEPRDETSQIPVGLNPVVYGTVIGHLHEHKESHANGIQFIYELTRRWALQNKSPQSGQADPLNGIYFGAAVLANYIGYITDYGEKLNEEQKSGTPTVISNDRVAELVQEFIKKVVTWIREPLELSNLDLIGIISITIAEVASCRGRRWHDFDLINKMIEAIVRSPEAEKKGFISSILPSALQKPERKRGPVTLTAEEQKVLTKIISRKFRLGKAVKDIFPKWRE